MTDSKLSACVKIAACVCAKDGVISEIEEKTIFRVIAERYPEFGCDEFELALNEFFSSDEQIEDYLALIDDSELRQFTLELSETSAGADGLDPRENIALEKAYIIWGMSRNA
jgi:hypothetical protein